MTEEIGEHHSRAFVDSAPIMEKAWANEAGLGWMGKNTNIINPNNGSFFFISVILTDLVFDHSAGRIEDICKGCKRCIQACPTGALDQPYQIDARKCISYLTIELKNNIPSEFKGMMEQWIFGCDICQDVCPWNRYSRPHSEPKFDPNSLLLSMMKEDWKSLNENKFMDLFLGSAVKRTGFNGLKRNIEYINNNSD